jgi:hypothetical protein
VAALQSLVYTLCFGAMVCDVTAAAVRYDRAVKTTWRALKKS